MKKTAAQRRIEELEDRINHLSNMVCSMEEALVERGWNGFTGEWAVCD